MDFDPDQSWQIERHYQDCVERKKNFGDKHTIIGDLNGNKNGWLYSAWGTSADVSTWREKNQTLAQAPERPLARRMVQKEEKVIVEEQKKSQALDQRLRVMQA